MFDEATTAFLGTGCALIIGTVDADGQPHAGRGWGLDLLPGGADADLVGHVVVDGEDERTLANVVVGGAVAVTATSVRTLRSLQMKGRSMGVVPATPLDVARAAAFCEGFFTDIYETDHTDPVVIRRMTPAEYSTFRFTIDVVFDQTPGPRAGSTMAARS